MAGEIDESLKDQVHPALTANRTMGSLASIAASRVARFLGAGGPSFAVCDEEAGEDFWFEEWLPFEDVF